MLPTIGIKALYALALAEGEGVGTAYEYFAKRLALARWWAGRPRPRRLLVAGLPQKYGSSLDLLQLAADWQAEVVVADEREQALAKLTDSLARARDAGRLAAVTPSARHVDELSRLEGVDGAFDLAISCEALQRLGPAERAAFTARLQDLAPAVALFAPNEDNPAHTRISGLDGLTLAEMRALFADRKLQRAGYIDMPPFPPGITRSAEQRQHATHGRGEALAMWGLQYYARAERWVPKTIRRRQAHIVYALGSGIA